MKFLKSACFFLKTNYFWEKYKRMQTQFFTEKLNNGQIELLKFFTNDLPESDLKMLKKILTQFKAELLMDKADEIWAEKGWTNEDVKRMLSTKMRAKKA
jgi:cytochrome c biogenesis protein ResB